MNLRYHLFVCSVNKGNEGGAGESKILLCYPRGLKASASCVEYLVYGVFADG